MKILLDDRWAPTTSELGFVECDLGTLSGWYASWLDGLPGARADTPTTVKRLEGGLESNLASLLPLTKPLRQRFLFQATKSPWTAFFDNGAVNTDAASLSLVARELRCRAVRVVAIPERGPSAVRRGAAIWELYGPEKTEFLNYVRSVSLVYEAGKWSFDLGGTPQPFEDQTRYLARRVRDRFDIELLAHHLEALGIRAFDESFYEHEGKLVEAHRDAMAKNVVMTLSDARTALGLESGSA